MNKKFNVKRIKPNCVIPSSAFSVPRSKVKFYSPSIKKIPEVGDLVLGEIIEIGHHKRIENKSARLHTLQIGTRCIFTFGNRYAPDQYEGLVPKGFCGGGDNVELFSQGGVIGEVVARNQAMREPSKVHILGYVCDYDGNIVNTKNSVLIKPKTIERKKGGAKIILCIGSTMNSGKTQAAAACCHALSCKGKKVRAAKITGTASLKDILLMNDSGAEYIADFTYFGYPSSYMMESTVLKWMFQSFDMKYGNNPKNYLVIEFADGIFQRETAMLLMMPEIRKRLHKVVFCAPDSSAVFGGIHILREFFDLIPDAISGLCSSSPLAMREIRTFTDMPILQSIDGNYNSIFEVIR